MLDKVIIFLGVPLFLIGLPLSFIHLGKSLFFIFTLEKETINLSYVFAIIPFLFWFWLLGLGGAICFFLKKKPVWSAQMNKALGTYTPIALACLAFVLGGVGKPFLAQHLLDNGYKLDHTIAASAPWRFDTDVYIKVQK